MKSSKRRIDASRANGKLSKGPKTPETKSISAQNATRHGLLAKTIVLDGESQRRFRNLLNDFTEEFTPSTAVERALVETMAVTRWRTLRLWGIEKAGLDQEIAGQEGERAEGAARAAQAFRNLSDQSRSLELLNRYEARYDRQFARALSRLQALKNRKVFFPNEPSPKNGH